MKTTNKYTVDCSRPPKLGIEYLPDLELGVQPFHRPASVKEHRDMGTVTIQRRGKDLYINGERIVLKLVTKEFSPTIENTIAGFYEACEERTGKPLSASILTCFKEHPELVPDNWDKKDADGKPIRIFLLGTTYYDGEDGHGRLVAAYYICCKQSGKWPLRRKEWAYGNKWFNNHERRLKLDRET